MKALFTFVKRCMGLVLLTFGALQVSAQNNCSSPMVIPSIPFSSGSQTTCGTVNDFGAGFASCVSSSYGGGEDYVYSINITGAPVTYQLSLGGTASWKIVSVHSACPPSGANCIGGISTSSSTSATTNVTFPTNGTYFIIIDTWPSPTCGNFTLDITLPPPPPANDACSNAIVISGCTSVTGNTTFATGDGLTAFCGTSVSSTAKGVWYRFTGDGFPVEVNTCAAGTTFDTKIQVYSGTCSSLTCVDGNDDDAGCTFSATRSKVTWTSSPGVDYYIYVYPFSGTGGTFVLNLISGPPCSAPTGLSASVVGTTTATVNWSAVLGATNYTYTISTSPTCPGGTPTITAGTSASFTGLIPNTTYYVCVRTNCACGSSTYVSTSFTTLPLPNDNCAGAITVSCNSTVTGSTIGATSDAALGSCSTGTGGTPTNGVWYKLVGDGSLVTVSLCGSAYDTKLHVYTGTCGSLTCVTSNDDFCGLQSQVTFVATAGVDYFIVVNGYLSATGAFSMNITCVCGGPLGAPWTTTPIGGVTGSATDNVCGGSIDISSNGFSPSLANDALTFAHQTLCGNQSITVRVKNVTNSGFAGIMFRENTTPGSRMIALRTQLTNSVFRDLRSVVNGIRNTQQFPAPIGEQWLRLVRNGSTFIGYVSSNGVNWQQVMVANLALPSCVQVGLFVQGINVNSTATAVFSDVNIMPLPLAASAVADGERLFDTPLEFSLFPNPTQNDLNVKLGEEFLGKQVTLQVSNQLGQTVMVRKIASVENLIETISVNQLPHGVYIMTVRTDDHHSLTKKFIVGTVQRP